MLRSYLGIATRYGLETLLPEHQQAFLRLRNQACLRHSTEPLCFWAVLPEDAAQVVQRELRAGKPLAALATLDQHAQQLGPLLPFDEPDRIF